MSENFADNERLRDYFKGLAQQLEGTPPLEDGHIRLFRVEAAWKPEDRDACQKALDLLLARDLIDGETHIQGMNRIKRWGTNYVSTLTELARSLHDYGDHAQIAYLDVPFDAIKDTVAEDAFGIEFTVPYEISLTRRPIVNLPPNAGAAHDAQRAEGHMRQLDAQFNPNDFEMLQQHVNGASEQRQEDPWETEFGAILKIQQARAL